MSKDDLEKYGVYELLWEKVKHKRYKEALTKILMHNNSISFEESYTILSELVERAMPLKLLEKEIGNIIHLYCPNCKRVVTHEIKGGRRYITKHNYCHKCGQAFKWEEGSE